MSTMPVCRTFGLALLWVATAPAQDAGIKLTGKPYIDMDYGAFLTASIEVASGNIAQKGIAIRLDDGPGGVSQGNAFVLFDTDTMRVAGFWTGRGLINWQGIAMDGRHATHPRLVGNLMFSNGNAAGWASARKNDNGKKGGNWKDTRLRGGDGVAYGPLPRKWAHWKGLHRQGSRVVLEYTVGKTSVREQPRLVTIGDRRILERLLEIGPSTTPQAIQLAAATGGAVTVVDDRGKPQKQPDPQLAKSIAVLAASGGPAPGHIGLARDFTVSAWIMTTAEIGTIFSRAAVSGEWVPKGKTFFVRDGKLGFDLSLIHI